MLSILTHGIFAGVQQPRIGDPHMEDPHMEDQPMEDLPMEDPPMEGPPMEDPSMEEYILQNAECEDMDEHCHVYPFMGYSCESAYLKNNCKKTCNICS